LSGKHSSALISDDDKKSARRSAQIVGTVFIDNLGITQKYIAEK
jgi:hypothetical protein